jgi:hypothetical protein
VGWLFHCSPRPHYKRRAGEIICNEIYRDLKEELDKYTQGNRTLKEYIEFRSNVFIISQRNRDALENYPGPKKIVGNIILAVLGLGIFYGIAVGLNYLLNDRALFFKAEPVNKLDAFVNAVDQLKNNPFAAKLDKSDMMYNQTRP